MHGEQNMHVLQRVRMYFLLSCFRFSGVLGTRARPNRADSMGDRFEENEVLALP